MTGLEIAGLNLHGTKLVVLSACNTAEGEVKDGEGVASLQLAFHLAGAESVASTLWSVPDQETADLMIQFFKNLSEGMAPPKALGEAQKFVIDDFKSKGKWAHPVLWAAFCVSSANPAHE
jgi:CHAT domain-containing protein